MTQLILICGRKLQPRCILFFFFFFGKLECEANLRRAKQAYIGRYEEYEKAKTAACKAEEEGGGSTAKSVEKKKRAEEEARNKVWTNISTSPQWRHLGVATLCNAQATPLASVDCSSMGLAFPPIMHPLSLSSPLPYPISASGADGASDALAVTARKV